MLLSGNRARNRSPGRYTSGTTGNPKGVKLTHGNLTSVLAASVPILKVDHDDVHLSYLPLAHIFERTVRFVRKGGALSTLRSLNGVFSICGGLL